MGIQILGFPTPPKGYSSMRYTPGITVSASRDKYSLSYLKEKTNAVRFQACMMIYEKVTVSVCEFS